MMLRNVGTAPQPGIVAGHSVRAVLRLSAQVCHHHARPHYRLLRRAGAVQGLPGLHGPVLACSFTARWPTGPGIPKASCASGACSILRAVRWCIFRRAWLRWPALWCWGRAKPTCDHIVFDAQRAVRAARDGAAVVRLVWLQRRLGPGANEMAALVLREHQPSFGRGAAGLDAAGSGAGRQTHGHGGLHRGRGGSGGHYARRRLRRLRPEHPHRGDWRGRHQPAAVHWKNSRTTIDDTLDVFPCHGLGGIVGMLLTGVFATKWASCTAPARCSSTTCWAWPLWSPTPSPYRGCCSS